MYYNYVSIVLFTCNSNNQESFWEIDNQKISDNLADMKVKQMLLLDKLDKYKYKTQISFYVSKEKI